MLGPNVSSQIVTSGGSVTPLSGVLASLDTTKWYLRHINRLWVLRIAMPPEVFPVSKGFVTVITLEWWIVFFQVLIEFTRLWKGRRTFYALEQGGRVLSSSTGSNNVRCFSSVFVFLRSSVVLLWVYESIGLQISLCSGMPFLLVYSIDLTSRRRMARPGTRQWSPVVIGQRTSISGIGPVRLNEFECMIRNGWFGLCLFG